VKHLPIVKAYAERLSLIELRELPENNLRILLALLPVFYVVTTDT